MQPQAKSYDAVAAVLARCVRSPEDIEAERLRFRSRARRDARTILRNFRTPEQFYSSVETCLVHLCGQDLHRIYTPHVAVWFLERALKSCKSLRGTEYYIGNKEIAVRSRLVQARFFRRFGFLHLD